MTDGIITLITATIVTFILYFWYISIVGKKNNVKESLSDIDAQLKKRSDLIPNILIIAKKFMEHENDLITKVTELRARVDYGYDQSNTDSIKEHFKNVGALDQNLGKLMVAVEAYPTLKSDALMMQAQRTYSEVEEQITAARRFYNSTVTDLNNSIEIFPGNLLANLAGAKIMPFYETDDASKKPINARDFLN